MLKRIAMVAGLVLTVGAAAMAAPVEPGQVEGSLALTYKGIDQAKPTYGVAGRLGYMVTENIEGLVQADWYFQSKGQTFYTFSFGPALRYNFVGESNLVPYLGIGANFYARDKFRGGATAEVSAGAKYYAAERCSIFGEVAWEAVKSDVFGKTPFDVRVGVGHIF